MSTCDRLVTLDFRYLRNIVCRPVDETTVVLQYHRAECGAMIRVICTPETPSTTLHSLGINYPKVNIKFAEVSTLEPMIVAQSNAKRHRVYHISALAIILPVMSTQSKSQCFHPMHANVTAVLSIRASKHLRLTKLDRISNDVLFSFIPNPFVVARGMCVAPFVRRSLPLRCLTSMSEMCLFSFCHHSFRFYTFLSLLSRNYILQM